MLMGNMHNRRLRVAQIKRYADDMIAGRWKENTFECIKIQADGTIADGQHRLHAVVKSGCSIMFHVVFNVSPDVFTVLDTGRNRNGGDTFKVLGIKHDNIIPSMIQNHFMIVKNDLEHGGRMTNDQLLSEYNKSPDFWQHIARNSIKWYGDFAKILQPSLIGGMYSYLCIIDSGQAQEFFTQLCSGGSITNKTILTLRNKLIEDKTALRKMVHSYKVALMIKTWNAFRTNQENKSLKFDRERESFPKAV